MFLGLLFGFVTAIFGAWKDTRFEPFNKVTFFRSPILTELVFLILLTLNSHTSQLWLALSSVALERFIVEVWKGIRRQRPKKFNSPNRDRGWLKEVFTGSKHECKMSN